MAFFFPIQKAERITGFLVELVSKYQGEKKGILSLTRFVILTYL